MQDLQLTLEEVRQRVELIEYQDFNHPGETLSVGKVDLDEVALRCLELLNRVNAEPTKRYKLLRLQEIAATQAAVKYRDPPTVQGHFIALPEEQAIQRRQAALVAHFILDLTPVSRFEEVGNHTFLYDVSELERFYPEIAASLDIQVWTYEDWLRGRQVYQVNHLLYQKRAWGLHWMAFSNEAAKKTGKLFSGDYLSKEEYAKIETKQKELGEKYVAATLKAYRSRYSKLSHLPDGHPDRLAQEAQFAKAFTDRDFHGLDTFARGGSVYTSNGFRYPSEQGGWKNELYETWFRIARSPHLRFYHFAPPQLARKMEVHFPEGDAEALYRFVKELEEGTSARKKSGAIGYLIKELTLKELLKRDPGPATYEEVALLLPKPKGNKGERTAKDVGREYPKYIGGEVIFKKERIDQIISDLRHEGHGVKDLVLLQRVRQFAT
ncbi:hypothetical protein [Neolewinella xylanilytica]|nr:hypothetical protein [Neolewinella xylanilytica]